MMDQPSSPVGRPYLPLVLVVAIFSVALLVGGGYFAMHGAWSHPLPDCFEQSEPPPTSQADDDYSKWQKPLVAIVFSGQMHGYINPCGCSHPQYGGLERRYNFIQSLMAKEWDVVGIDLGELAALRASRCKTSSNTHERPALAAMNYKALGIGRDEMLFPLGDALAADLGRKRSSVPPICCVAHRAGDKEFSTRTSIFAPMKSSPTPSPKIGVINVIGTDLRDELEPSRTLPSRNSSRIMDELPKALGRIRDAGVEIGIVLHHEYPKMDDEIEFPKGGIQRP